MSRCPFLLNLSLLDQMKKKKAVNPPTEKEEALLDSIVENSKDTVEIRGRKWHVEWMRNGTKRRRQGEQQMCRRHRIERLLEDSVLLLVLVALVLLRNAIQ